MKTIVIYHRADFDGIFCREIARKFLPQAELIGWDFGDEVVKLPGPAEESFELVIMDLPVDRTLGLAKATSHAVHAIAPNIIWIDHHKSSIENHATDIPGYRIDGVAACRLAWQWFQTPHINGKQCAIEKQDFIDRKVDEPLAVRLAGEYDIWDKRDPDAELFQHGLRSQELDAGMWANLLSPYGAELVELLLAQGKVLQYAQTQQNESIIKAYGFTVRFQGLCFLVCNHARFNSHLFTSGIRPEHEGLMGFNFDGQAWRISLYGVPGKPDVDLSQIAVKYGGGGHKQACGFRCPELPFSTIML